MYLLFQQDKGLGKMSSQLAASAFLHQRLVQFELQ